eukprot:543747-Prymnesium_polylepis.1
MHTHASLGSRLPLSTLSVVTIVVCCRQRRWPHVYTGNVMAGRGAKFSPLLPAIPATPVLPLGRALLDDWETEGADCERTSHSSLTGPPPACIFLPSASDSGSHSSSQGIGLLVGCWMHYHRKAPS